jgi:transcriptional regulator with XRE-family HTH domain
VAGEIGRVIKRLREQAHLRQADLAKQCSVKQPNLSRIEKGRSEPRHATLERIAEALGSTVESIEAEAARLSSVSWPQQAAARGGGGGAAGLRTMLVPVFDTAAGYTIEFDSAGLPVVGAEQRIEVPLIDVPCFACRVSGDSMVGHGRDSFVPGDVVVFAQRGPRNGDFAYVRLQDGSCFKQVFFEAAGVRLVPLNRAYEERRIAAGEVAAMWKLVQHVRTFE